MFHNGSIKDNLNYRTICPLKQKQQNTRITYQANRGLNIHPWMGTLGMEEDRLTSIQRSLERVDKNTQICHHWEIYKLLFILHNVNPFWIYIANDDLSKVNNFLDVRLLFITKYLF